MIQLDTNSLSCFHCQVLLKRSGLAMPRSLPKMEMSQVHNGCVVSITFPFKNIFSDQKKYGSPLTEAVPIRKESHPFSKIMVSVLELGLLYPKMDQTNTAFYLGKWGFYVSDHEVNQNEYSESQSKNVSVLKISARIFPSTRRLIWSIMILYASICILFVWKSYHHFSLCRCHVRALKPSERSPSRHVLQIDQIFSGVVFLLLHLLQGIGHVFHPTLVQG